MRAESVRTWAGVIDPREVERLLRGDSRAAVRAAILSLEDYSWRGAGALKFIGFFLRKVREIGFGGAANLGVSVAAKLRCQPMEIEIGVARRVVALRVR